MSSDEIIRISGLTKRFGDLLAVDRVDLGVHKGEILGFLGPNGAGKTTAISMICGLLKPSSGKIEINGKRKGAETGRKEIGLCPQEIVVWETLTCLEQLDFMAAMYDVPAALGRRRALELLEKMGLSAQRNRLARTLSGGMQRRLNIVLALIHEPEILILDEPQAGLDPQSRVLVRDYVRSLAGKMTVILTTHDMEEADKLSDRIAIIDRGRLLVLDSPERLKASDGEGEVIEAELTRVDDPGLKPLLQEAESRGMKLKLTGRVLTCESRNAASDFNRIFELARTSGVGVEDFRIRRKTLEDVFIRLTGKGLRE